MTDLLWLVPAFPFAGFLILALGGRRLSYAAIACVGVGAVGLSAVTATLVSLAPRPFTQILWTWMSVDGFAPAIALRLDSLSVVMILVVAWVGFLIHVYSVGYMAGDEGYRRFFAHMNLFVASMLTLVLADDLLLLYLGWEGVGLCSYLLIGHWYKDPANGRAAIKAFVVTRVGDTTMAIALFIIFLRLGTLRIQDAMAGAHQLGSASAIAVAALLLGGAVGKSAQLPLQTWLPDAMAGPTPVSALIHAATMVTAGVYLIARTFAVFELAQPVLWCVAIIGAATMLLAGISALAQTDIKRVLAYSTISQIGLMFMALGVGATSAAIFHFMTHAFFKALLFMAAGSVILSLHHEQEISKMGGLRRQIPATFWTFLIGAASLAGFPLVTAGFYSKEMILGESWSRGAGFWIAGVVGALLTSIYIFRVVFVVFFGEAKGRVGAKSGPLMMVPIFFLAALSVVGGWIGGPRAGHADWRLEVAASAASLLGIFAAWALYVWRPGRVTVGSALRNVAAAGGGFDWLYDRLLVRPFLWTARVLRGDYADAVARVPAWLARITHGTLSLSQTGLLRWYAAAIVIGVIVLLTVVMLT